VELLSVDEASCLWKPYKLSHTFRAPVFRISSSAAHKNLFSLQSLSLSALSPLSRIFKMTFHPDSLPDLSGKVYVVTGGNAGMSGFQSSCNSAQLT
jgi:hypothetical protein